MTIQYRMPGTELTGLESLNQYIIVGQNRKDLQKKRQKSPNTKAKTPSNVTYCVFKTFLHMQLQQINMAVTLSALGADVFVLFWGNEWTLTRCLHIERENVGEGLVLPACNYNCSMVSRYPAKIALTQNSSMGSMQWLIEPIYWVCNHEQKQKAIKHKLHDWSNDKTIDWRIHTVRDGHQCLKQT